MIEIIAAAQLAATLMAMPCDELQQLPIPRGDITSAQSIPEGPFTVPRFGPPGRAAPPPEQIPAHCRVKMVLTPTSDSNINVELWLPVEE